jgi:hypothetical protein
MIARGGQAMIRSKAMRMVPAALAGGLLAALAACNASLDKVRLRFEPDRSGQINFQLSADREGLKDSRMPQSLIDEIKDKCHFVSDDTLRGDTVHIQAQLKFDNAAEMATDVDCLPLDWTRKDITITRSDGLFATRYTTTIRIEQPALARSTVLRRYFDDEDGNSDSATRSNPDDDNDYERSLFLFPKWLELTVPGEVKRIDNQSDMLGMHFTTAMTDDLATISLDQQSEADREKLGDKLDAIADRLNRGEQAAIPDYVYKFVVTSSVAKVEIGTITTILGALFGSGALVALVKFVLWLRNRMRPPAP